MTKLKLIIFISLLLCLIAPAYYVYYTNNITSSTESITNTLVNDTGKDVAKKKSKDIFKADDKFFTHLFIDIVTLLIIIILIYYPNNKQMESIFTFVMFNIIIFMLTIVFNKIKMSVGAAFGLFAVFSMLRYRTQGISMKDMTYLFIFIGIGLISAIQLEYNELIIINTIILFFTALLDCNLIFKQEHVKRIDYEIIELIKPENRQQLIDDIQNRTGLKVNRIKIDKVNFLKDSAQILIYYYE